MKKILVILFLTISSVVSATRYYVSTSGNDANDGLTATTPWKTIQYAETRAIIAGDVIALKKGDVWSSVIALGIHHGGIAGNPIIWDGSLWGTGANAIIRSSADHTGSNMSVVNITGCSYVTFQNITVDGNNTYTFGLVIGGTDNMYSPGGIQNSEKYIVVQNCSILNIGNGARYAIGLLCQTWRNGISDITIKGNTFNGADDEQLSFYGGKKADGGTPSQCKNVYIGYNTLTNWGRRGQSTGYGLQINNKITDVIIENNTLTTGISGRGNALHIESNEPVSGFFPERITIRYNKIYSTIDNTFCIYITNGQAQTVDVYNNLLYSSTKTTNGGGVWIVDSYSPTWTGARLNFYNNTIYTLGGRTFNNDCAVAGVVTLKNNLLYNAGNDDYGMMCLLSNVAGATTHSNNLYYRSANANYTKIKDGGSYKQTNSQVLTWETTAKAADPLFKTTGTDFHLQTGSPATGGGMAITGITKDIDGMTFNTPPEIGCYQANVNPPLPVYLSSVIENTTPSLIEIAYDLSLSNIVPAASTFIVLVNSVSRSVNSVTIVGGKVRLTLSGAVIFGDIVTVSYTKPALNPLQTISGGQAVSISAKPVTSKVLAVSVNRYYVSTSGNDANDGRTTTTPWKTIQYAESHAVKAGDVIALKKGDVWSSATALGIHHGGIAGNPIIWDGSLWGTGANAIIRSAADRTGSNMSVVNITGCSYVTFQNITVDGNNTYTFGLVIGGTDNMFSPGGIQNAEKYIVVQNCAILNIGNGTKYAIGLLCQTWHNGISDITIKGNTLNGADDEQLSFYGDKTANGGTPSQCKNVYIGSNTLTNWGRRGQSTGYGLQINNKITDVIIENNTLTTGISGHGNAIQIESNEPVSGFFPERITIRYNKIYSTIDNTFCVYITHGQAKTVDVYNNLIYSSTKTTSGGGVWIVDSPSPSWTGARLNFYNNTIYTLGGRSFNNDCAVAGVVTLKNNLLYNAGSDDYGMMCLLSNVAGATTHSNNLYYRSANANYTKIKDGGSYKQTNSQVLTWETTAKTADPLFKTTGTDFHLQTGSPATGGGLAIYGITKDIDGVAFNTPPEIGCYQSVSSKGLFTENAALAVNRQITNTSGLNIYPNPAHRVVNISIEPSEMFPPEDSKLLSHVIRIFDLSGKLVMQNLTDPGVYEIQFPINLKSGVYVVQVEVNGVFLSSHTLIVTN